MFDNIYDQKAFEKVKNWFSLYLGKQPTDEGMLLVMYVLYKDMSPSDAIFELILKPSHLSGKLMAKFYHKFELEGKITSR